MANYKHSQPLPLQLTDALRMNYHHTEFKREPREAEISQRAHATYSGQSPFSEEELTESLGWVDYSQSNAQLHMNQTHNLHLSSEMAYQTGTPIQRNNNMLHKHSSTSIGSPYGSLPIPKSVSSVSGWHSSMETPSHLTDASVTMGRGMLTPQITQQDSPSSFKKEPDTVAEKKAMRRYSHNAVERRRRDNINEQIHELSALVSELGTEPMTETVASGPATNAKSNKGLVLRRSVEYIRMLKSIVEEKTERERLMELEILRLGGQVPRGYTRDPALSMWIDESAIEEDDDI